MYITISLNDNRPYTLEEYKLIRPQGYYPLGKLKPGECK